MNTAEDGLPVGMSLSVLDSAIANIALPAIAKEIHASPADSIWVVNAYQLAVVCSLLPLALPTDLFRRPVFALSVTTSVCAFVAQGIVFVALPFYFQDVIGRSQVETGLLMTPWPVPVAMIAPIAGRLADQNAIRCGAEQNRFGEPPRRARKGCPHHRQAPSLGEVIITKGGIDESSDHAIRRGHAR